MKKINIDNDTEKEGFINNLKKAVQSANLNFIIGSGCSYPAINPLGNIENEIQEQIDKNNLTKAKDIAVDFLIPILKSSYALKENRRFKGNTETISNYKCFIDVIYKFLKYHPNNSPRQASIFTTNYDLYIEKIAEDTSDYILINDGFKRTPSLTNKFKFYTSEFFNSVCSTGNLYNYKVDLPAINLLKIHGSLNWQIDNGIIFHLFDHISEIIDKNLLSKCNNLNEIINLIPIILPTKDKFELTILKQVYYDLLRIYSNQLDKENTMLIAEGFSFADEHLFDITKRALKNPTLKLVIFCHSKNKLSDFENKFSSHNNVHVIYSENDKIKFDRFCTILPEILPEDEKK